jgi:peptide/nickel transport system substrate-binding protein
MRTRRTFAQTWLLLLVVLLAAVLAGCGGASSPGGGPTRSASATTAASTGAAPAGAPVGHDPADYKVAWNDVDYLDPALAYSWGWMIVGQSYLGLLGYSHASATKSTEIVPGLAEAMPRISADRRTYTFTLRPGLRYSDGRPVKAGDFKYAVERMFKINSPALGFVATIVGADRYAKHPKGSLAGITVDEQARTVTFKLTKPRGDFLNIIALSFLVPVPQGTPAKDQSTTPIPSAGPFEIKSYQPGQSFVLLRNQYFKAVPGIPAARPARVDGSIVKDPDQALQLAIDGKVDYDFTGVPTDRLAEVKQKYPNRLKAYILSGTQYFWMNEAIAPFDKLGVRQALNYAIDRTALARLAGGLASPTQNFLPPSYPSYRKISTYRPDVQRAKALIKQAGAVGAPVTILGPSDDAFGKKAILYLADQLQQVGLKPKVKLVSSSVFVGTAGGKLPINVGWGNWNQDYPHPLDWFDVLLNGERLSEPSNVNWGKVDIKPLNAQIDQLKQQPSLTSQVNAEWAAVDKGYVVDHAAVAPYANNVVADFFGPRADTRCYVPLSIYRFDLTQACIK